MRIGIDLGGTKIEAVVLNAEGTELLRERVPTPRGSYVAILDALAALVVRCEAKLGVTAPRVGIGIPGTISPHSGLVKNANTTELIGHALDKDLSDRLARPVCVANDANCFALSEALDGAALSAGLDPYSSVIFGVILGTGVGGGLVVHGNIVNGRNAIAGEWGHNPLPWPSSEETPGESCWCGKRGCLETWLSGPALTADHARYTEQVLAAAELSRRAGEKDTQALASLERYATRLARALAGVLNILDPDAVILGGGISNIPYLYERIPQLWQSYVFSDRVSTLLLQAQHGDSSGVRGAAWL